MESFLKLSTYNLKSKESCLYSEILKNEFEVWEVKISEDDIICKGDIVVILKDVKRGYEVEFISSVNGVVGFINVNVGQIVTYHDVILQYSDSSLIEGFEEKLFERNKQQLLKTNFYIKEDEFEGYKAGEFEMIAGKNKNSVCLYTYDKKADFRILNLSFSVYRNSLFVTVEIESKLFKLSKGDRIFFLFNDSTKVELVFAKTGYSKGIKRINKVLIEQKELEVFFKMDLDKWKLTNEKNERDCVGSFNESFQDCVYKSKKEGSFLIRIMAEKCLQAIG